jgi:hypothetical protein
MELRAGKDPLGAAMDHEAPPAAQKIQVLIEDGALDQRDLVPALP